MAHFGGALPFILTGCVEAEHVLGLAGVRAEGDDLLLFGAAFGRDAIDEAVNAVHGGGDDGDGDDDVGDHGGEKAEKLTG